MLIQQTKCWGALSVVPLETTMKDKPVYMAGSRGIESWQPFRLAAPLHLRIHMDQQKSTYLADSITRRPYKSPPTRVTRAGGPLVALPKNSGGVRVCPAVEPLMHQAA